MRKKFLYNLLNMHQFLTWSSAVGEPGLARKCGLVGEPLALPPPVCSCCCSRSTSCCSPSFCGQRERGERREERGEERGERGEERGERGEERESRGMTDYRDYRQTELYNYYVTVYAQLQTTHSAQKYIE